MAGNHFSITFDAKMNVGQVKGAINEMKKGLEQLKLPPELEKGVGDNLTKLANEMKRFEDLSSKPMRTPSDFKALEKSGDKIFQLYNRIRREASEAANMSPKNMEKFFPASVTANIEKATAALEKYKAVQASIEDFKKAQKRAEGDFSLDTKEYKDATAKLKRLQKMEADRNSELEYRKTSNDTRNAYKGKDNATLRKEITEITTEAKKLENTLTTLKMPEMTKAKTEAEELGKVLKDLGFDLENLGKADDINLNNLKSALKDIEGLDSVGTLDDFENIKKVVEGLKPAAAQQLLNNLKQMSSTAESSHTAFDGLQEDIRKTGQAVEDADARFRDVSAFKSRISMFLSFGTAMRTLQRAVRSSFETIKELDATMTETAVVTDFSVGDMWKQLPKYTKMANELGVTTNDAYKAATLYYQQGLSTNQVMAVSNETLKMARIAGIDAADATDYMTAALRGFNMEINEVSAQRVNDVYSKLAAETASDTEELSIAMSKTASIASNANMEFENTAALLAQIIETTREAPETAGTAMKTIIARFSEVKELFSQGQLMGSDEEGEEININKIDAALKGVGISLKSFLRGEVGLDDILLELASKWDTLDLATQRYIATTAAGSRQQSRFLAMMSNYSRTVELTDKAYNAAGAGQEQYEKTLDSMETALNRLKNAWDQFAMGIANSSLVKGSINGLTGALSIINKLGEGLGGLSKSVVNLGLAFGGFQLGRGVFDIFTSFSKGQRTLEGLQTGAGKTLFTFGQLFKDFKKERSLNKGMTGRGGFFAPLLTSFTGGSKDKNIEKAIYQAVSTSRKDLHNESQKYYTRLLKKKYDEEGLAGLKQAEKEYKTEGVTEGVSQVLEDEETSNMDKLGAKMQILGAASSVAGVGLMKVSDALEKAGHSGAAEVFDTVGASLLGLGTTLTTVGMILPGLTKAFPQLETAITSALGKIKAAGIGGALPMLAAVAAAIIAIKVAMEAIKAEKALSLEGQLESTEKAIQRAREEAQQAKDAYDELLETKNKYNDTQKAMEGLAKGTQSWSEALMEANTQVTGLIDKTPGLAEYLEVGNQGQLSITNEGWEYLQDYSKQGVRNSQYALLSHELRRADLLERKELRDFAKETLGWREGNSDKTWGSGLVSAYTPGGEKYYDIFGDENFAKIFAGTREAPTEEMKAAAKRLGMTVDEVYDNQVQFAKLNSDLIGYHSTQVGLAKSLLSSSASEEALNYEYSDQLFSGLAERMTDFDYSNNINAAANKIADVNGEQFQKLAEEYGVAYKMGMGSQQDLETLYAAMKNIDVETVSEANLSKTDLSKEIATMAQGAVTTDALDSLTNGLRSMTEEAQQQVATLLSGNITDLTFEELQNMDVSKLGKQLENALGPEADSIMQNLGFDSMNSFIGAWNQKALVESYAKNIKNTLDKIRKYSKNTKDEDLFVNFEAQQSRFKEMGLQYQSMVNSIFSSLEEISDPAVISAGWEAFSNAINDTSISAEQITEIQDWITGIDWSNPIEGAYALGDAVNSSNKYIQEIGNSMQEMGSTAFDASTQMKYFLQSDFDSIKEDLKDVLAAGEEITGADIRGLAKNYKNLDKMLQNTGMSATSLGKALTMINKGELKEFQLTNAVLSAIGHAGEIEDLTSSVLENISNFDPGYNEGDITGFIKSSHDAISELLSSNLGGSQQIGSYLDYWFGSDWDAGLETADQYIAKVNELNGALGKYSQDMAPLWQNIMSGKDALGNPIDTSAFKEYGFSFENGNLVLAPDASLEKMVKGLQDVGGLTKNMAEAMIADEKARNPQLMLDLRNREFPSALTNLIEGGTPSGYEGHNLSILDQSEIDAVLGYYGKSMDDFNAYLESNPQKKIHILDLYDENGNIKDVNDAFNQIGKALGYKDESVNEFNNDTKTWEKVGKDYGQKFKESFISENKDTGKKVLKSADFDKLLTDLRIPQEAQDQLRQGFYSSIQNGMVDSFEYLSEATGRLETIDLGDFDWGAENAVEQLQQRIAENDEALEIKVETDKLRESITGALDGLTIDFSINNGKITLGINSAVEAADTEVEPTFTKPDTSPITTAVSGLKLAKTVVLNFIQTGLSSIQSFVNSITGRTYNVGVNVNARFSGGYVPPAARTTMSSPGYTKGGMGKTDAKKYSQWDPLGILPAEAKGIKKSSHGHIALTGEEGPEIHQLANGGFYITGTAGPSIDYVAKGDTIYTADETKKIMSGRRRSITRKRFSSGVDGSSSTPIGERPGSGSSNGSSNNSPSTTSNQAASNSKKTADNTAKAADDAEKWENSFDHLYNLTQDINAELRTREKLEKQYQRYLKERIPIGKTLAQISKSELYSLEQQRKLQERMLEARKHDIVATEEEYKDYNQYAHYNWQDQTIEIDWDKINGVTDKDQGEKIEKYIDKLEEIQDQIQDTEDAIDKIYDDIQEIRERGENANAELQDKVLDALIDREQEKIDLQEKTNQAINDAANDLHDAISRNIEKMRQDRENEKTREDLAEKERRLAYLRMDTTGGNALEIKKLEKEIEEQREQFSDDLVDQALNNMQEQNSEAADQRQRQIDLLQGVLDFQTKIGYFATRALEIVNAGTKDGIMTKDSELHQLLIDENQDYWEKSVGSRNKYLSDIAKLIAEKYEYDEFVESERNLKNGGYMTQMMNATSAEEFRQAEEARNTYVNNHPEEGYATTGFSQAYKQGQINSIGYNEEDIFGKKDENGFLIAGTGINWQAEIDKAIKEKNWEKAAMMEGYRDLKISRLKANDPARAKAKMTYGSQAATAYANATGSKTASGAYGKAKYQPASHDNLLLLDKAKSRYNSEYSGATETPGTGGYMALMQEAIADGNFDLAYYYAKLRDEKTSTTGKDYGEPDAFQYVYDIEKGYGNSLEKAQNYYQKGFDKGYTDGENYMNLIENELSKSKPNWGQAFIYAGQRDNKLQNDPSSKKYSNGKEKETWNYVLRRWPKKFKTGGLVEGTGLAWLDGTPSRPEYVLNAGQTQAFLRLSDMVGNLTSGSNQQLGGDTYINVDINVDQIASDYDVEMAAEKVKQIIYQDSMYRNVNRINLLK